MRRVDVLVFFYVGVHILYIVFLAHFDKNEFDDRLRQLLLLLVYRGNDE